jgi:tetratricopeptide (TPR) repeat protein
LNHFRPKEVLHRAQESERLGNYKDASHDFALLGSYLRKKNRLADAILMFERSIRLTPDSGRIYLEKGICEWQQGQRDQALESVDQCVRLGLEKRNLSLYLSHLKKVCSELPELRKRFLECWLSIDRTHFQPFLELGAEFASQGAWSKAKTAFLQGLRLNSDHQALQDQLEAVVAHTGSQEEQQYFERFKRREISILELATLLGEKEVRHGKIQSLKTEGPKDLKDLVADLERELELEAEGTFADLEPLMREFIRRSDRIVGEDSQARLDLAFAFYEMGRRTEAKAELRKISASSPVLSQSQILMGKILCEEGSQVAALGAYLEALRHSRKDSNEGKEALYQLSILHLKLCDTKGALQYLGELEKIDPHYRDIKQIKKDLGAQKQP